MTKEYRTPHEQSVEDAKAWARRDFSEGKDCDPGRHHAGDYSAWADWYRAEFAIMEDIKRGVDEEERGLSEFKNSQP